MLTRFWFGLQSSPHQGYTIQPWSRLHMQPTSRLVSPWFRLSCTTQVDRATCSLVRLIFFSSTKLSCNSIGLICRAQPSSPSFFSFFFSLSSFSLFLFYYYLCRLFFKLLPDMSSCTSYSLNYDLSQGYRSRNYHVNRIVTFHGELLQISSNICYSQSPSTVSHNDASYM